MHPTLSTPLPASTLAALVLSLSTARQPDTERAKASEKRSHRPFLLQKSRETPTQIHTKILTQNLLTGIKHFERDYWVSISFSVRIFRLSLFFFIFLTSTPFVVATPNPLDLPIPILFRWWAWINCWISLNSHIICARLLLISRGSTSISFGFLSV